MKAATLTFNASLAQKTTQALLNKLDNAQPLFNEFGEYLLDRTQGHFKSQSDPWGLPWKPISEEWVAWKKKNKKSTKILIMDGYLSKLMRYQTSPTELLFGSDRPYAAIHQFGGEIKRPARKKEIYFKRNKDGSVGNRFVKRKDSDYAETVDVGAFTIKIPARPFLGIAPIDEKELLELAHEYLARAFNQ